MKSPWHPPDFTRPQSGRLGGIHAEFAALFPPDTCGDLADKISRYWISKLSGVWNGKAEDIKAKDLAYRPWDPISRVAQKTVLIAYADSVCQKGKASLTALETFLASHFPAIGGLHILPPCEISEERFNDGGFSQIRRDRIHGPYGTNTQFEAMMAKYFSMTDLVLNHVDMAHPRFTQYLNGDDLSGECFFVFSEAEYRERAARGDFDQIFRPRPFPLFTIFRRQPKGEFAGLPNDRRVSALNGRFEAQHLAPLPEPVVNLLSIFHKIRNDQMLLDEDYRHLSRFRRFFARTAGGSPEDLFVVSEIQETRHTPYIFRRHIRAPEDVLTAVLPHMGIPVEKAGQYAQIYTGSDTALFGEPIRALTTFSHVQVDLNTATLEGLKLLVDDFSWYLQMDLNMLRLDAANFAFKKWGTTCFGLPEVNKLLKILYLSMDCVSPRIVPNLEVNAPLGAVLKQMADKQAPPPMMYDFHLACMLPVVFNTGDVRPLDEIFQMIGRWDIPRESIRFSLDESHDGKSVSGSGGTDRLLTYSQRSALVDVVKKNGGHVKYKSTAKYRYPTAEFLKVCEESGIDHAVAGKALFEGAPDGREPMVLRKDLREPAHIAKALNMETDDIETDAALRFFADKILNGREPYELCVSTWDALEKLGDPALEAKRYMAFKTLAFALMGRNVKSIYFNDLMGLPNDHDLVEKTGELRNIKRTKSDRHYLARCLRNPANRTHWIAGQMNNTIALLDADPAFHPRGREARLWIDPQRQAVAVVHNCCHDRHTVVVVNTGGKTEKIAIKLPDFGLDNQQAILDNITRAVVHRGGPEASLALELKPFDRCWLKNEPVIINPDMLVDTSSQPSPE